jgi:iron complex transport system ATP-binding protein
MKELMKIKDLTVDISGLRLLDQVSLSVCENDRWMIVGPNGAGKSTLIKAIAQSIAYQGEVSFAEQDLARLSSKQRAKLIGVFTQNNQINYGFKVEEVVSLGRYAYSKGAFGAKTAVDREKVEEALSLTGLSSKRQQSMLTLSGGELQRVFLAQLLAQDPKVLLLDEPTNHLDIQYQQQLQAILNAWAQQKGRAVIAVVHDLSLACLFGNKLLLLNKGRRIAEGPPNSVLKPENLHQVYEMDIYAWMQALYEPWQNEGEHHGSV